MKTLYALVGMKPRGTEEFVRSLPHGEPLVLLREPTNPYDKNCVQVWARNEFIGFVSGRQVEPLARSMDAAHLTEMTARLAVKAGGWPLIEVGE